MTTSPGFVPDWPVPEGVGAFVTLRGGGFSEAPYASNNLGSHVGDEARSVARNRQQLSRFLGIEEPRWLNQVHGTRLVEAGAAAGGGGAPQADGVHSTEPGRVCAVLTADCLPLLLCDRAGRQVAAVHCGWRGLAGGIIHRAVKTFSAQPEDLLAFLGPAISARHYEVGPEVEKALAASLPVKDEQFSEPVAGKPGHYRVDLYAVARIHLGGAGVTGIHGGNRCTFSEVDAFYSYRRDGVTGRMASLIWRKPQAR